MKTHTGCPLTSAMLVGNLPLSTMLLRTLLVLAVVFAAACSAGAVLSPDSCDQNVDIPDLYFSEASLNCQVVWSTYNFILRYYYEKSSKILSILLSANTLENWVAIGFSPSGDMVGSSAMVGYLEINGTGVINQYYLAGKSSQQVLPGEGNLTLINEANMVVVNNRTIYMAFQITINQSSAESSKLIYAYGFQNQLPDKTTGYLTKHKAYTSTSFDFSTGTATTTSSPTDNIRRNHGIANILGWAVLAPIGAFIARYFRQWDPAWFYLHIGFQFSGFLLAVTGVALGIKLTKELPTVNWHSHRALGIFVLVLGILQIIALCLRPHKEGKVRKYWNWYHHIVGRLVLFLAAVNIIVGLRLAGAGPSWKAGYAVLLVVTLVCFAILESVYWCKQRRDPLPPRTTFPTYDNM